MSLPKPVMRGLLGKRLRLHLPIAFGVSVATALIYKFTVTEPRKQAYANFYKQYDSVKEFNAMREAGIFESVRPSKASPTRHSFLAGRWFPFDAY